MKVSALLGVFLLVTICQGDFFSGSESRANNFSVLNDTIQLFYWSGNYRDLMPYFAESTLYKLQKQMNDYPTPERVSKRIREKQLELHKQIDELYAEEHYSSVLAEECQQATIKVFEAAYEKAPKLMERADPALRELNLLIDMLHRKLDDCKKILPREFMKFTECFQEIRTTVYPGLRKNTPLPSDSIFEMIDEASEMFLPNYRKRLQKI